MNAHVPLDQHEAVGGLGKDAEAKLREQPTHAWLYLRPEPGRTQVIAVRRRRDGRTTVVDPSRQDASPQPVARFEQQRRDPALVQEQRRVQTAEPTADDGYVHHQDPDS